MGTITELNPRLLAITDAGVSVWLDQIRRSMVEGGELARMVDVESLRGVTSNPSIFEKAILGSTDYDDDLRTLARENLDSVAIYEHIAIRDVQLAADVLAGVFRDARGRDGFVSLEVAPELAHNTEGTLEQVRSFWKRVDRANVMIKIPGTPEGVPAIEEALYEGINVNVTLLFSVAAYEDVVEAYLRALERRHAEGLELAVNSVASFFVSRVDTAVDRQLEQLGRNDLAGTAALANARAAYRRFQELFSGPRWGPPPPSIHSPLRDRRMPAASPVASCSRCGARPARRRTWCRSSAGSWSPSTPITDAARLPPPRPERPSEDQRTAPGTDGTQPGRWPAPPSPPSRSARVAPTADRRPCPRARRRKTPPSSPRALTPRHDGARARADTPPPRPRTQRPRTEA